MNSEFIHESDAEAYWSPFPARVGMFQAYK
jgi:hypothetical protein